MTQIKETQNFSNAINAKQNTSEKGQNNGYAGLDATGKVPLSQLPSISSDIVNPTTYVDLSTQTASTANNQITQNSSTKDTVFKDANGDTIVISPRKTRIYTWQPCSWEVGSLIANTFAPDWGNASRPDAEKVTYFDFDSAYNSSLRLEGIILRTHKQTRAGGDPTITIEIYRNGALLTGLAGTSQVSIVGASGAGVIIPSLSVSDGDRYSFKVIAGSATESAEINFRFSYFD